MLHGPRKRSPIHVLEWWLLRLWRSVVVTLKIVFLNQMPRAGQCKPTTRSSSPRAPRVRQRRTTSALETGPIPDPGDGQILLKTRYLSLDPYMRGRMNDAESYASPVEVGGLMEGEVIAEVVQSRHPAYRVGELVRTMIGWRTHAAVGPERRCSRSTHEAITRPRRRSACSECRVLPPTRA